MNIYVGNMSYDTSESKLQSLFSAYGTVDSAKVITDRDTGRPKGFGFVEMPNQEEALAAIEAINGQEVDGRKLNVNEARPKPQGDRGGRGGFGGGRNRY